MNEWMSEWMNEWIMTVKRWKISIQLPHEAESIVCLSVHTEANVLLALSLCVYVCLFDSLSPFCHHISWLMSCAHGMLRGLRLPKDKSRESRQVSMSNDNLLRNWPTIGLSYRDTRCHVSTRDIYRNPLGLKIYLHCSTNLVFVLAYNYV